jgi:hypothetical protein
VTQTTLNTRAGTPVSTTNKSHCHDIAEILLKVALNTITLANDEEKIRKMVDMDIN